MGHPDYSRIADDVTADALQTLHLRLSAVEHAGRADRTIQTPTGTVDGGDQYRVTNLADPSDPTDALNLRTLRQVVQAAFIQALRRAGIDPNSPPSRPGVGAGIRGL